MQHVVKIPTPALEAALAVAAEMATLASMPPTDRARWARHADRRVRAAVGRVGDEAAYLMQRQGMSHDEIAEALGVTPSRVNATLVRHRRWLAAQP